ncbi:cardiolipin synthase ClsB [Cupriavidus respiraculi]|uniref:Cardiolipin synthase B n=1 Tax=Cupriavidus respiraculi TaxID=195930 RepID=A0ABN7Y3F3_9BURK|nr:cardiolipin synthase ClsB [Cupriavidus respiraculi]MBY4948308.1 cardiolipin synthase ClsB [Cupriavidus respiraculi]CAG9167874.1 Cardiolipin synthase B [Cupriavidus respiraculi]
MSLTWTQGNSIRLLENGEEYFPAVFAAIAQAKQCVLLETFILFDDRVGQALREALIAAAQRGVHVAITVDGFGSHDLSAEFITGMVAAGVQFNIFAPRRPLFGIRTNVFRRLHRKLVAIDGVKAFVGGINFSIEHLWDFGPQAKQDYAVEVDGPIARDVHRFLMGVMQANERPRRPAPEFDLPPPQSVGPTPALLVTRDNDKHRTDIELHYLKAIRSAKEEIIIANAYFLPGYRLLHALCDAARRGVRVQLILQGNPDMPWVKRAADMLYAHLHDAGVKIYEYCERPFHGKVALADGEWATVGSSNLDPLSLSLNLEANLVIRDAVFTRHLREKLQQLMDSRCREIEASRGEPRSIFDTTATTLMFHFLRRFPAWAGWLPAHTPTLVSPPVPESEGSGRIVILKRGAE